ncbi:MAG: hypothetical protein ACK5LR_01225 [Mangrovibacterium sp.]
MSTETQKRLRQRIMQLEVEQSKQRQELTGMAKEALTDFQNGSFIQRAVHSLLTNKQAHKDLFSSLMPVVSSFISGIILRKTKHNNLRWITALGQLGIDGLSSSYGSKIKNYAHALFEVGKDLFSKKTS